MDAQTLKPWHDLKKSFLSFQACLAVRAQESASEGLYPSLACLCQAPKSSNLTLWVLSEVKDQAQWLEIGFRSQDRKDLALSARFVHAKS